MAQKITLTRSMKNEDIAEAVGKRLLKAMTNPTEAISAATLVDKETGEEVMRRWKELTYALHEKQPHRGLAECSMDVMRRYPWVKLAYCRTTDNAEEADVVMTRAAK